MQTKERPTPARCKDLEPPCPAPVTENDTVAYDEFQDYMDHLGEEASE